MNTSQMKQLDNRIEWLDVAKGITILLVIAGHTGIDNRARGLIYSFHMVLFFITSGWTMKLSADFSQFINHVKKNCKRLILPVIGIFIAEIMISIAYGWKEMINRDTSEILQRLVSRLEVLLFSSGDYVRLGDRIIEPMGMPWFFVVLFFGKTLYDLFHMLFCTKVFYLVIIVLSYVGVRIGRVYSLPFSLDVVMAIMVLLLVGQVFQSIYTRLSSKLHAGLIQDGIFLIAMMCMWIMSYGLIIHFRSSYLEFAGRRYPFFPICYLCAICGTLFVFVLSRFVSKIEKIQIAMSFLGRNTMGMLIIHCFDNQWNKMYYISETASINLISRILIDTIILVFMVKITKGCTGKNVQRN